MDSVAPLVLPLVLSLVSAIYKIIVVWNIERYIENTEFIKYVKEYIENTGYNKRYKRVYKEHKSYNKGEIQIDREVWRGFLYADDSMYSSIRQPNATNVKSLEDQAQIWKV